MKTFFENDDEIFAIAAATLVLFSAMLDARISFAVAGIFLVIYSLRKISSRKNAKKARRQGKR